MELSHTLHLLDEQKLVSVLQSELKREDDLKHQIRESETKRDKLIKIIEAEEENISNKLLKNLSKMKMELQPKVQKEEEQLAKYRKQIE